MRTPSRAFAGTAAALVAGALVLAAGSGGRAAPAAPRAASAAPVTVPGDSTDAKVKDNRVGRAAPTSQQRERASAAGARARWNALGTPATLTASARPLASGLPADPVAAARAYVDTNRDVLGLTARGADALELVTVAPMGEGAVVLFRQRFGDLVAAVDGMLSVGVRDGAGLARQLVAGPRRGDAGAGDALRRRGRAGRRPRRRFGGRDDHPHHPRRGAHRRPGRALRVRGRARRRPARRRPGGVRHLRRRPRRRRPGPGEPGRLGRGQPGVGGLPELAADQTTRRPTRRVRWCFGPDRGCDEVVGTPASRLPWDVDPATGLPTNTTNGNNAIAVHNWDSNDPFTVGTETATPRPDRDYVYPWTNQWYEESCNPDGVHLAAAQRHRRGPGQPVRHAQPHARLVVPPRLHRGHVQHAAGQLRARRARQRPGAGQRPGRRDLRRAAHVRGARQRQPDHARRRHRRRSPTCTCGSRSPARSTRPAWTATSTCR